MAGLIQLYPQYKPLSSIRGVYLSENVSHDTPVVYANFLSSLDGRIAVKEAGRSHLPEQLTNDNDFRLFLELQAHTDCLVTHGAYLRARATGQLGDILNIGRVSGHKDLHQWRHEHGWSDSPALVICSKSLDFPEPEPPHRRRVIIAACQQSPQERLNAWHKKGYRVIIAGDQMANGKTLTDFLKREGYRTIFLAAGPKLLASCIHERCLNRLYLTISHQLIATENFHTLIEGIGNDMKHCHFEQTRLIYDTSPSLRHPQWYVRFNCHYHD